MRKPDQADTFSAYLRYPDVPLVSGAVAHKLMQPGDNCRVDMFGNHQFIAQVESGWINLTGQKLERFGKIGPVM